MSWKAEVIRACACGMSRLRKDLVALEYRERRVASVPAVELELSPALVLGLEAEVVVEDMGMAGITCFTLTGFIHDSQLAGFPGNHTPCLYSSTSADFDLPRMTPSRAITNSTFPSAKPL